jgi:CRISPR/Cas system-associated endoribonuclease Cas2
MTVVAAYDVSEDRRRARLAALLQTCGDRVQFSVLVLQVADGELVALRSRAEDILDSCTDSLYLSGSVPTAGSESTASARPIRQRKSCTGKRCDDVGICGPVSRRKAEVCACSRQGEIPPHARSATAAAAWRGAVCRSSALRLVRGTSHRIGCNSMSRAAANRNVWMSMTNKQYGAIQCLAPQRIETRTAPRIKETRRAIQRLAPQRIETTRRFVQRRGSSSVLISVSRRSE